MIKIIIAIISKLFLKTLGIIFSLQYFKHIKYILSYKMDKIKQIMLLSIFDISSFFGEFLIVTSLGSSDVRF
jgi:hypothetical protein